MEITLWHGGRNLEDSYKENHPSKPGRWEHGAGLYLTTHYETARKYSKGNGKSYEVTVSINPEKCISNTELPVKDILDFYSKNLKKLQLEVCSRALQTSMKRMNNFETVNADIFQNLIINYEAITSSKTPLITAFLVEHGVEYGLVKNFAGRPETVLVIYDKKTIKKVKPIPAKDISLDLYERPFPETNHKMILSENIKSNFKP